MFRSVFVQAFKDNLQLRRLAPWLILGLLGWVLANQWQALRPQDPLADRYSNVSYIMVFRVLALASAIFTTAIISSEVEQKTIVYLLTRPIPRWTLLLGRYLASVLAVIAVSVGAAICASAGVYGSNAFHNPVFWRDIVAICFGAFAYGGFFLLISLMFNRGMIICLLFAFGWESSVPKMPGDVFYLSIFSHLQGIARHPVSGDDAIMLFTATSKSSVVPLALAITSMIGLTVLTVALSAWWFTHFEFVPREDAS